MILDEWCPKPPRWEVPWDLIERALDRDVLAATPQGADYHAEGDVWIHTRMVGEVMAALPAWRALPPAARAIVFGAGILHDVGKPATTRIDDDGAISARGHSARGEQLARRLLWTHDVPFAAREHVCALIRSHQVPFFLIEQPATADRQAARLSLQARLDWLALVAEADARGRRCTDDRDQARIVDNTALFALHCRELGVLDRPRGFASEHTRMVWLRDEGGTRSPDVLAYDDTAAEVVLMSGLPGSGKDSWLARHRPELPIVSLDDLREELDVDPADSQGGIIAAGREAAREHLRVGRGFAWNATNLSRPLRQSLIDLFIGYRARVHIVYCEVPAGVQARQNRERAKVVPASVIDRMIDRWSVPSPVEAHAVTYAVTEAAPDPSWPAWPPQR